MRSGRSLRKTIIVQRIVILLLCVVIIAVSFVYLDQMRLNRFSKNIIFSENYFLRNYALAYSSQLSSSPNSTYTINEAEALVRKLVNESGAVFLENSWIFVMYRPERALERNDILAYYYNYLLSMFAPNGEFHVLFSPQINEIVPSANDEGSISFSEDEALSHIAELIERSFEWDPAESNYIDKYTGPAFEISESFDSYGSYQEYLDELKNKMISSASALVSKDPYDGREYTVEDIHLLYYDSIAESMLASAEFLTARAVLDLLDEYEYEDVRPRILDAEHISQLPEYPNGCEAVSAVMLLKYAGYDAEKNGFIEDHLETGDMKIRFGIRFGPDPVEKYAGDPSSERGGWGCFAPVIVNALESYLTDSDDASHTALNVSGVGLSVLCETFIDRSIPVTIWVTQDFSAANEVYQWLSYDRDQVYLYPKNQHCVMLIGYDKDNYYVCDPLKNEGYTAIAREDAELSYASMGSQAVVLMTNEE